MAFRLLLAFSMHTIIKFDFLTVFYAHVDRSFFKVKSKHICVILNKCTLDIARDKVKNQPSCIVVQWIRQQLPLTLLTTKTSFLISTPMADVKSILVLLTDMEFW